MAALFALTALVPIAALAAVAYVHVSRHLSDLARRQLRHSSKTVGMDVVSGLRIVTDRMQAIVRDLSGTDADAWSDRADGSLFTGTGLRAVTAEADGRLVTLGGPAFVPPTLDEPQRAHIRSNRPLLVVGDSAVPFLAVRMGQGQLPDAVLWARLDLEYLWGGTLGAQILDDDVELCIVGPMGVRILSCTMPEAGGLIAALAGARRDRSVSGGYLDWENGGTRMVGGYWSLFLEFGFGAPAWTIVLAQPRRIVLAPLVAFRLTFGFVVLLTIWIVFFLSQVQIRRSLVPLATLKRATDRIAGHHFGDPVEIDSTDEFADLAASFNSMTGRLQRDFAVLEAINGIDRSVLEARRVGDVVHAFMERAPLITGCRSVHVSVGRTATFARWTAYGRSASGLVTRRSIDVDRNELAEVAAVDHDLTLIGATRTYILESDSETAGYFVFPIRLKGEVAAVVALGFSSLPGPDARPDAQASRLIDQFAVGLSNTRYVEELDEMGWGAIQALSRAVDAKSTWTAGHSERVTRYALQTGRVLGLSQEQLVTLHRGGLLHDIGKIGVPEVILNKTGQLTDEEMALMREHTVIGGRVLEPIRAFADVVPIAMHHHEKLDGTGYPHQLAGDEIPLLARVLAVPDVYDALRSDRPYRAGWPRDRAIAMIRDGSGSHFDPQVVVAFLETTLELAGDAEEAARSNRARPASGRTVRLATEAA